MASNYCGDWVKISEMLLGPVPESFVFLPKHKANAYAYLPSSEESVVEEYQPSNGATIKEES